MIRINNTIIKNNLLHNIQRHKRDMDKVENRLATGKRYNFPHQSVVGVANLMVYNSRLNRYEKYAQNIDDANGRLSMADSSIENATMIFTRLKELAIQAANATYNAEDRRNMAFEVNEYLKQLVSIANTKFNGQSVFSGFKTSGDAFVARMGRVEGVNTPMIVSVEYMGNAGDIKREIDDNNVMGINLSGNKVFWAENQSIVSSVPAQNYIADRDQIFRIDGVEIKVSQGDNLETIVRKINDANIGVVASIDNTTMNYHLVLETTTPHQIMVEDIGGGSVMQDLGIIERGINSPPKNISLTARVSGKSAFDAIISLRDDLLNNRIEKIGGRDLALIDSTIDNLVFHRGEIGAKQMRLDIARRKIETDKSYIASLISNTEDIDYAKEITELKTIEFVNQAALAVTSRILRPSLLDYLR